MTAPVTEKGNSSLSRLVGPNKHSLRFILRAKSILLGETQHEGTKTEIKVDFLIKKLERFSLKIQAFFDVVNK